MFFLENYIIVWTTDERFKFLYIYAYWFEVNELGAYNGFYRNL